MYLHFIHPFTLNIVMYVNVLVSAVLLVSFENVKSGYISGKLLPHDLFVEEELNSTRNLSLFPNYVFLIEDSKTLFKYEAI